MRLPRYRENRKGASREKEAFRAVTVPVYEWMGGKARHAEKYGYRFCAALPEGGHYYEGFAGAASVAIFLGQVRPDVRITLTDSNACVVNGLTYIRDKGDPLPVLKIMKRIAEMPDLECRKSFIEQIFYSEDPIEWLAGANSVRPARNAWPYPQEKIVARMRLIPQAWKAAKEGLKNATILREPMGFRECDAAFFDPPYFASSFEYYGQRGQFEDWFIEIGKFKRCAKYILVSDNIKAAQHYVNVLKFRFQKSGLKLNAGISGVNVRDEDGFFEWKSDPKLSIPNI